MGMSCMLRALTERQIEVLFANPERVWDAAYNEDWTEEEEEGGGEIEPIEALLGEPLLEELFLDKSWAILRFLLLKSDGAPVSSGNQFHSDLFVGELIGDEPADYVGPFLREIEDTREFADFLRPLTQEQLLSHFDWKEMCKEKVYLCWEEYTDQDQVVDLREYAGENFVALREYVLKAAASRCGLLCWVN